MNSDFSYLTPGKLLHDERKKKGLDIEHVALSIKIRKDYLNAIEVDDFSVFESPVYAKGFIKLYARFLGVDEETVMALYRRFVNIDDKSKGASVIKENSRVPKFNIVITSKTLAIGAIVTVLLIIFSYLLVQVYYFQKPPNLQISMPTNEKTETENRMITVGGYTDISASVLVNDSMVSVDEKGYFETDVSLRLGDNVIIVKAVFQDTVGRETIKQVYVTRLGTGDSTEIEEVIIEDIKDGFTAKITVSGGEAWIEAYVDDEIKVARVVPDGYAIELEATDTFRIVSGLPSRTKVYIDDVEQVMNTGSGVGSLSCKLESDNSISCE